MSERSSSGEAPLPEPSPPTTPTNRDFSSPRTHRRRLSFGSDSGNPGEDLFCDESLGCSPLDEEGVRGGRSFGRDFTSSERSRSPASNSINVDFSECTSESSLVSTASTGRPRMPRTPAEHVEGALRQLARTIFEILQATRAHRWISDLIVNVHDSKIEPILRELRGKRSNLHAVIWHPERGGYGHLHLYHACRYQESHCRCYAIGSIDLAVNEANPDDITGRVPTRINRRVRKRKILYCRNLSEEDLYNWLQYFCKSPRRFIYLEGGMLESGYLLHRLESILGCESLQSSELEGSVASCGYSCEDDAWLPSSARAQCGDQESSGSTNESDSTGSGGIPERREKPPSKILGKLAERRYLTENIKRFLAVPLAACVDCREWLNDCHLCFYDRTDDDFKRAISQVSKEIAIMNHPELLLLHQATDGHYGQRQKGVGYYLSREDSYREMRHLLAYQAAANNILDVNWLVLHLWHILERFYKKRNSFMLTGPPNSGKTWFADFLAGFYVNTGQIGNFNRYSTFPLNDAPSKRFLIWNEPNIEPSQFDTVKMLTGGDPLAANVKYQNQCVIDKTPICITSNRQLFVVTDSVWQSRITFLSFRTASFLKDVKAYPDPRAWHDIVETARNEIPQDLQNAMIIHENLFF